MNINAITEYNLINNQVVIRQQTDTVIININHLKQMVDTPPEPGNSYLLQSGLFYRIAHVALPYRDNPPIVPNSLMIVDEWTRKSVLLRFQEVKKIYDTVQLHC